MIPFDDIISTFKFIDVTSIKTPPITVLSPNGGEILQRGTNLRIRWSGSPPVSFSGPETGKVYINLVYPNPAAQVLPCPVGQLCPAPLPIAPELTYPIAGPIENSGYFEWIVGTPRQGLQIPVSIPDGIYKLRVAMAGDASKNDSSDAPFTIISTPVE